MCGRFTQRLSTGEFARIFGARDLVDGAGERYNVAPAQPVVAVVARDQERVLDQFRWGLVPGWAESPASGRRMFNARAETIASSPAFRHSFRAKRCLIPVDGFYEWRKAADGTRQPHYITAAEGTPLVFAGLWSAWRQHGSDAPPLLSCTIVTTTPNALLASLHSRMPVILPAAAWDLWLDSGLTDVGELPALLRPSDADLVVYPVSPLVGSVRNQGPGLIAPTGDPITSD